MFREAFQVGRIHGIKHGHHDPTDHATDELQIKMAAGSILTYFNAMLNPDGAEVSQASMVMPCIVLC